MPKYANINYRTCLRFSKNRQQTDVKTPKRRVLCHPQEVGAGVLCDGGVYRFGSSALSE